MHELESKLDELARLPCLLVATDYDGTLAPIVDDPAHAAPQREALVAVASLASLPQTHVAIISGRALSDLAALTGAPAGVHLVGSHGGEFDPDFIGALSPDQIALRERVREALAGIAQSAPGAFIETKPAGVALHYRNAPDSAAKKALDAVFNGPASFDGVHTRRGKMVVELAVIETNKGLALDRIRRRVGATGALFLGDDLTDEDAFATLAGPDVGVKIGEGDTRAAFRIDDPHEVARLLAGLAERRARWAEGSAATPIERLSYLSDLRTGALVTPDARVVWMCAPRFDSPALFAELLGGPHAGRFTVAPEPHRAPTSQAYEGDSLILRTRWNGLSVADYLDVSSGRWSQRAGRTELVRVVEGSARVRIEFAPRLDFGRVPTRLATRAFGLEVDDTADPIVLHSPGVRWTISKEGRHHTAHAVHELGDEPLVLTLRYGAGGAPPFGPEDERRRRSARFWEDWAAALTPPTVAPAAAIRSALTLRGLVYGPTGAILAAATTSLPEHLGGVRNWDYRFCWPRDAAIAARALLRMGSEDEAMRFLDWFLGVMEGSPQPDRIHPVYTVSAASLGSEAEIAELSGYAGSRPVRVGNLAARQIQLDVLGPVAELLDDLAQRGAPLSGEHWRLTEAMASAVMRRWREPDHGIWEIRLDRRHHIHSRAMCWTVLDRAVRIADLYAGRERRDWADARDQIRDDVLRNGWSERAGAFTTAYGHDDLDAAALAVGLCGLLTPSDPRFVATVEAIDRSLRDGPVVRRYTFDDGLPGLEGGFHICTAWLVEALALIGERPRALALFEDMASLAGHTGLMPEQHCNATGRALGNHPQAYSHAGLILAAFRLEAARP
ncbi:MAG: trehalose-phosphatase [Phycisphaerales bacterium]|nr:trehalose-phosphatase [Phycisphaerales bacterium]